MAEIHQLVEAIRRLARKGATPSLARTVDKARAEDIAVAIRHLGPTQIRLVFGCIKDDQVQSEVLTRLDLNDTLVVVEDMPFERLVALLDLMEVDDEADVIARLPEELAQRAMKAIHGDDKEIVEDILAWPEDSAGGIMQPIAFRLKEFQTCRDAISALHEQEEDLEMVFYIYVENEADQLVGVTSLRALLTHGPSTALKDIMEPEVITVGPQTDQEDVARMASRYDLLAIPVVDENRRLLGIVTIDDVVDVIKEEAAEDMMLMAGVGDDIDAHSAGVVSSTRQRLPWLVVTLLGGIAMAELIGRFEVALAKEAVLAGFIPVMMGLGGNVGIQAATITVRNIAIGRAESSGILGLVLKEARVGLLLGTVFAVALGGYAALRHSNLHLGGAIAASGVLELIAAASLGSLVPLIMQRLRIDPAVATGPFVTTSIDLVALSIYFTTCMLILGL
ncbi:magnesium transporter [Myxococcota bacterium]|nr:magnesium transporter [Myxococcota bacterium]